MRTVLALLTLLTPVACSGPGDYARIVDACWHGRAGACAERSRGEQAELDANAIMMGMQSSSLRAASTQGRAR